MATSKQQQQQQLSVSRIDSRAFSFIAPGAVAAYRSKLSLFLRLRSADDTRSFMTSPSPTYNTSMIAVIANINLHEKHLADQKN